MSQHHCKEEDTPNNIYTIPYGKRGMSWKPKLTPVEVYAQ